MLEILGSDRKIKGQPKLKMYEKSLQSYILKMYEKVHYFVR